MYSHGNILHYLVNYTVIMTFIVKNHIFFPSSITVSRSILFLFPFFAQIHADTESMFPHLHGAGLGLLCVHDGEEYCPGEGAPSEGGTKGHGCYQWCHLVHLVY